MEFKSKGVFYFKLLFNKKITKITESSVECLNTSSVFDADYPILDL